MEGDRKSALKKLEDKNKDMRAEQGRQRKQKSLKFRLEFKQKMRAMGKGGDSPAADMEAARPTHPSIERAGGIEKAIKHGRLNQSTDYGWQDTILENIYDAPTKGPRPKVRSGSIRTTLTASARKIWDAAQKRKKKKVTEAEGDIKRGGIKPGKHLSKEDLKAMIERLKKHTDKKKAEPKQMSLFK